MTQYLPPNLLALFAPRESIPFIPPVDKLVCEKNRPPYRGLSSYLHHFENPAEKPPPVKVETKQERMERKRRERAEIQTYRIEKSIALWNPAGNPLATSDPYKTLFISRLNYMTSESKMRREFEPYGPIKKISIIRNVKTGKPRGYAFIEYENERDMHAAYKNGDGKKIDGRRLVVDVERGRTVKGWLPRRFGGGIGNTRAPKAPGGHPLDEDGNIDNNRNERRSSHGSPDDRKRYRSPPRDNYRRSDRSSARRDDYRSSRYGRDSAYRNERFGNGSGGDYRNDKYKDRDRHSRSSYRYR